MLAKPLEEVNLPVVTRLGARWDPQDAREARAPHCRRELALQRDGGLGAPLRDEAVAVAEEVHGESCALQVRTDGGDEVLHLGRQRPLGNHAVAAILELTPQP